MRTIRIRKFMVVGMISVVIFPWMVYFVIHFNNTIPNGPRQNQKNLEAIMKEMTANSNMWDNPSWQIKMRNQLSKEKVDAEIVSLSDHLIFKSGNGRRNPWLSNQQVAVLENGQMIGTVKLYTRWQNDRIASISALSALIFAIFFVGFQMRRSVVKPLEAMSEAARRIAEGDFELKLPKSKVREIAEVRSGFEVMVAGLSDAFEKQARLEEERRFFIGAIAHDLRTPMFALRGYLDGLEQGIAHSPEKVSQYVKVCKEKANQLDRLVNDLFSFTRLEYMEQTIHFEKMDISAILDRSLDSLRPLAKEKGINIEKDGLSVHCEINGDPHLLERAVSNLLDNSIRHTPPGGKIVIEWGKGKGKILLSVKDNGPGFKPEDLKHVFEPLYRGEASRNRTTGGAGLGLAIAKRIFKAHGGDLMAANGPFGGAVLSGWLRDDVNTD